MNNVKIGFEFEFYNDKSLEETKLILENLFKKNIHIFNEGHSDFIVDSKNYKLERDYSGGKKMFEFITGPELYNDALYVYETFIDYLKKNCYTTEKSAIQINISFINENLQFSLNKLKFILDMDENFVYEGFENRKNNLYAKSIKKIIPNNIQLNETIDIFDSSNYIIPNSKYYGVNFDKLKQNYLEFRYLGGKDYQFKDSIIKEKMNYFIKLTEKSINGELTKQNKDFLMSESNSLRNNQIYYKNFQNFKRGFPNLKLYANLIESENYVSLYFDNKMRKSLTKLIVENNITEGVINYNSDSGLFELKDMKIYDPINLEKIDLINCDIYNGNLINVNLFHSRVHGCNITNCATYENSYINNSKLINTYISSMSEINNSYIAGQSRETVIMGKLNDCIFRSGSITNESYTKSVNTEFIDYTFINDDLYFGNINKNLNK